MNRNKDIILISDTESEYIDKIIVILNENKKRILPEEVIIKQAEKIIYEYENSNCRKSPRALIKYLLLLSACLAISLIGCFAGMHLF